MPIPDTQMLPSQEPFYILRPNQKLVPAIVREYAERASALGYPTDFVMELRKTYEEMLVWQRENPSLVVEGTVK